MSDFDRIIREREKAAAAATSASRARREKTWNEAVAATAGALEALGRLDAGVGLPK